MLFLTDRNNAKEEPHHLALYLCQSKKHQVYQAWCLPNIIYYLQAIKYCLLLLVKD